MEDFQIVKDGNMVYKLKNFIYGLKQVSRHLASKIWLSYHQEWLQEEFCQLVHIYEG